jgi:hypothetical protein
MNRNIFFQPIFHYAIYLIAAFAFSTNIDISFNDDGLRHIAFAANENIMKNWGEIFPHSLFGSYDPWFLWHKLLSLLLHFIPFEQLHIAVNLFTLSGLMVLLDIYIRKYIPFRFGSLTYILVFIIIYVVSYRYMMIRPDQLSGLFVFTALILKNRFLSAFIITILYAPFYYIFFIYTGSIGLVYLVQKKHRAFWGILLGSLFALSFHLLLDYSGYLHTIYHILTDQSLRMGLSVTEGEPIFGLLSNIDYFILVPLFTILVISLLYFKYEYFKGNSLAAFFLITSIIWINQYRYFHLFLPFFTVYIISIAFLINKKQLLYTIRKYLVLAKRSVLFSQNKKIFYLTAIPYSLVMLSFLFSFLSKNNEIDSMRFLQNKEFNNKVVLVNQLQTIIYKGLYLNPTIKFIPSCSIGWFDNKNVQMKNIYIKMQKKNGINEEELSKLIKYTNADIYIHFLKNEKQILNFKKLIEKGIIPDKIQQNMIIFKVEKNG